MGASSSNPDLWRTKNHSFPSILFARLPFPERGDKVVIEVLWGGWVLGSDFDSAIVVNNFAKSNMPLTMRRFLGQDNIPDMTDKQECFSAIKVDNPEKQFVHKRIKLRILSVPPQITVEEDIINPENNEQFRKKVYPYEQAFLMEYLQQYLIQFIQLNKECRSSNQKIAVLDISDGPYTAGINQIQQFYIAILAFKISQNYFSRYFVKKIQFYTETSRQAQIFAYCLERFEQTIINGESGLEWLKSLSEKYSINHLRIQANSLYESKQQSDDEEFMNEAGSQNSSELHMNKPEVGVLQNQEKIQSGCIKELANEARSYNSSNRKFQEGQQQNQQEIDIQFQSNPVSNLNQMTDRYFRSSEIVSDLVRLYVTTIDDPQSDKCVCGYKLEYHQYNASCVMCWINTNKTKVCNSCDRKFCFNCKPLNQHQKCTARKSHPLKFTYQQMQYTCDNCNRDNVTAVTVMGQQLYHLRYECRICNFDMCYLCRVYYYCKVLDKKLFAFIQLLMRTNLSHHIISDLVKSAIDARLILDDDKYS